MLKDLDFSLEDFVPTEKPAYTESLSKLAATRSKPLVQNKDWWINEAFQSLLQNRTMKENELISLIPNGRGNIEFDELLNRISELAERHGLQVTSIDVQGDIYYALKDIL